MERLRVMLVSKDRFASLSLSAMLQNLGHQVIACSHCAIEASDKTKALTPDVVMVDVPEDERGRLPSIMSMMEVHALPIVLVIGEIEPVFVDRADALGVSGYIVKPASQIGIQCALVIARSRFRQLRQLQQEIVVLKNTIRSRKLIEQAKGLLMEREGITEAEAFRKIQSMSRNQNIPMAALSEAFIMTDKLTTKAKKPRQPSAQPHASVQDLLQD